MRKLINGRLALSLFFVTILILFQFFIPARYRTAIIGCSLVDPNQTGEKFSSLYGIPLPVVSTDTVIDCSGNPTTQISDFSMAGLLVDMLFVAVVGALPSLVFSLFNRFRLRNHVA